MRVLTLLPWALIGLGMIFTVLRGVQGLGGEGLGVPIAGPILLTIGVLLLNFGGFGKLRDALGGKRGSRFAGAPLAIGTIVEASTTGLEVNGRPQLELVMDVDTPDGKHFRASTRELISVAELAQVKAGLALPVRYLPDSADGEVMLDHEASQEELQKVFNRIRVANGEMTQQQLRIAEHGVDGQAVVLDLRPTGEIRNDKSLMSLTMRVTRPDGSQFDTEQQKAVDSAVVPQLQPGMVVRVRYLPHDESEINLVLAMPS